MITIRVLLLLPALLTIQAAELALSDTILVLDMRDAVEAQAITLSTTGQQRIGLRAFLVDDVSEEQDLSTANGRPITMAVSQDSVGPDQQATITIDDNPDYQYLSRHWDVQPCYIRIVTDEEDAPLYAVPIHLRFHRRPSLTPVRPFAQRRNGSWITAFTIRSPDPKEVLERIELEQASVITGNRLAKVTAKLVEGEDGELTLTADTSHDGALFCDLRLHYSAPIATQRSMRLVIPLGEPERKRPQAGLRGQNEQDADPQRRVRIH